MINNATILAIDDQSVVLNLIELYLTKNGFTNIILCDNPLNAELILKSEPVDLILLDLNMPQLSGDQLYHRIKQLDSTIPVVIVSAENDLTQAIHLMKSGIKDYLQKPIEEGILIKTVVDLLSYKAIEVGYAALNQHFLNEPDHQHQQTFGKIISRDERIKRIFNYISALHRSGEPFLITGETGTGKELIAEAIHRSSKRTGSFIPVNIAGLDDTLFSDTLFGHTRGAFTDAHQERKGLIEMAENGTLFLDEIGDLSPASQVKLLRLLQERKYYPVGSDRPKYTNTRIVVATNRTRKELEQSKSFRQDLFYRLNTHHIHLPPLRDRMRDLPLLIEHFVKDAADQLQLNITTISQELTQLLSKYTFPGNIRELRGMIFDAVARCDGAVLTAESLGDRLPDNLEHHALTPLITTLSESPYLPTIKEIEWLLIHEALKRGNNNQTTAARFLGITQQALSQRLKRKNGKK